MRILVVEDQKKTAQFIRKGLVEHGYAVDIVDNGQEAENHAELHSYDLIVLDVMLPRRGGGGGAPPRRGTAEGGAAGRSAPQRSKHFPMLLWPGSITSKTIKS